MSFIDEFETSMPFLSLYLSLCVRTYTLYVFVNLYTNNASIYFYAYALGKPLMVIACEAVLYCIWIHELLEIQKAQLNSDKKITFYVGNGELECLSYLYFILW